MNSTRTSVFVYAFGLAALALFAGGCLKTNTSTETGNPPFLDADKVALHTSGMYVHVIGAAGAVTPGGGSVSVENIETGATAQADVATDGSFDAEIQGSLDDHYEVLAHVGASDSKPLIVSQNMDSLTSDGGARLDSGMPADPDASMAANPDSSIAMPACQESLSRTAQTFQGVRDMADRKCMQNSDCVISNSTPSCVETCNQPVSVSQFGSTQIENSLLMINPGCQMLASQGCKPVALPCVAPTPSTAACVSGQCALTAECTGCASPCLEPFDAGRAGASGAQTVYFHDATSGSCLPRLYYGLAGNNNRFASFAECQAACPQPSVCPAGRVNTPLCLSCGLGGGCGETHSVCALPCNTATDCAQDTIGSESIGCSGGFCEGASLCI